MHQTSRDSPRLVRFGVFELDLRAGELRKSGVRLRLQQQPLQLLWVLLDRPGEIVTREELRRRLWPDDTFVDFEHGLNAAVKRLRDTLGDTADSSRFIETLPKRGDGFVAPTDVPAAPISLDFPSAGATDADSVPIMRLKRGWLLVALAVVIAAAGAWAHRAKPGQVLPVGSLQVMPFTTFPGQEVAPTFSPDGSQIAFAWSPNAATGQPVTAYTGPIPGLNGGPSGTGYTDNQRPNRTSESCRAGGGLAEQIINPDAYTLDGFQLGSIGTAERGDCTGPGYFQTDLAFYRTFRVTDAVKLQFRWDVFNVFNNTNFRGVNTVLQPSSAVLNNPAPNATIIESAVIPASFGQATSTRDARQMQFGLKIIW